VLSDSRPAAVSTIPLRGGSAGGSEAEEGKLVVEEFSLGTGLFDFVLSVGVMLARLSQPGFALTDGFISAIEVEVGVEIEVEADSEGSGGRGKGVAWGGDFAASAYVLRGEGRRDARFAMSRGETPSFDASLCPSVKDAGNRYSY
jgi:hypothetical protein